jgi:phenylalanine-4-hydroxylase
MAVKTPSSYIAHPVDANGNANYTQEENNTWQTLIARQLPLVKGRACDEYMRGMRLLNLPKDRIPQCPEVSQVLLAETGWSLAPVTALISFDKFFKLLANRQFPAATFIRRKEDLDYLQEPDMFHEVFGHCPMLTNKAVADFTHTYGKLAVNASHEDQVMLARLYWMTIEFGLIQTKAGLRIYGGGILSSKGETLYALESPIPIRSPFDVLEVLRTPYRIDIMQPIYFVIEDFDILFRLIEMDLLALIQEARQLGMHKPLY